MNRSSGILMPIFSLPSPYGIGTLGKAAYDFADFLAEAGAVAEDLFAEAKVPMHTLSNYGAVLTEAEKIGYITPDLKPLLDEWRKDPAHWRQ